MRSTVLKKIKKPSPLSSTVGTRNRERASMWRRTTRMRRKDRTKWMALKELTEQKPINSSSKLKTKRTRGSLRARILL